MACMGGADRTFACKSQEYGSGRIGVFLIKTLKGSVSEGSASDYIPCTLLKVYFNPKNNHVKQVLGSFLTPT